MAKKVIHHPDLETLLTINKAVVALTGEPHEYALSDGQKLAALVKEDEHRADNQEPDEAVGEKAALLVFKLASGQYFKAGNMRTALVAGSVFLKKNGYAMDVTDGDFLSTVDKAGVGAAGLDETYEAIRRLSSKSKVDRRGWDKVVAETVASLEGFLKKEAAAPARESD